MDPVRRIRMFFLEGPAGGGKTSVRDKLVNDDHLVNLIENPLPVEITRPRAYNTHDSGASLSLLKDFRSLLDILSQTAPGEGVVENYLIDRCFVSQIIYHSIRTQQGVEFLAGQSLTLIPRIVTTTQFIMNELSHRNPEREFGPTIIDYRMIFVIPENEVELQVRRNLTQKVYPYDAFLENQLYLIFYDLLEPEGMKFQIQNWKDYQNKLIPWIQSMPFPLDEEFHHDPTDIIL